MGSAQTCGQSLLRQALVNSTNESRDQENIIQHISSNKHHASCLQFHLVMRQNHSTQVNRPTCAGSLARNKRFGNSFTDSTSTNRVLRLSRCTGRLLSTASVDRMDDASMTTSGCSSAKSSASWKKWTPRDWASSK